MQYRAFVDQVRKRGLLEDSAAAKRTIQATLETLGERLVADELEALADHLPPELASILRRRDEGPEEGDVDEAPLDLDEFYRRVARRAGVDGEDAVYQARIVISVLAAALPAASFAHLRALLPEEFGHLFAFVGKGDQDIQSATARDNYW